MKLKNGSLSSCSLSMGSDFRAFSMDFFFNSQLKTKSVVSNTFLEKKSASKNVYVMLNGFTMKQKQKQLRTM